MAKLAGHEQGGSLDIFGWVVHHALSPVQVHVGFIDFEDRVDIRAAIGEHLVMVVHHLLINRREHLHGQHQILIDGEHVLVADMGMVILVTPVEDAGLADHGHAILGEVFLSPEELRIRWAEWKIVFEFLVIFILAVLVHPILIGGPHLIPHHYNYGNRSQRYNIAYGSGCP